MAQVVVSHWDGIEVLPSLMSRLKQHILEHYATKLGLSPEREFTKLSDHVVVDCDEQEVLSLLSQLQSAGCTDIHIYSNDATTRKMVESGSYGPFRVCAGAWKN